MPFTTNGRFPAINKFTVQISDASGGNFKNLETTGTTPPLTATLPADIQPGTYKIRVIGDAPETIGTTTTIVVSPIPPRPIVADYRTCQGQPTIPLSATGTNIRWYSAGGTPFTFTPALVSDRPGVTYFMATQTVNGCESLWATIQTVVVATPTAPVVSPLSLCQGQPAPVPLTGNGQNLLWRSGTGSGDNVASITTPPTAKPDTLRYAVTQQIGGCISPVATLTVIVRKAPDAPNVITPVSFCIGTQASVLGATGTIVRWYTQADRSGQFYGVLVPPTEKAGDFAYFATQLDANNCESQTNRVDVRIKPRPTAVLPRDTAVYRYDSLRVQIGLTGDAPWRVTLWDSRTLTATQSPLIVGVKPLQTSEFAVKEIANGCGLGSTNRALKVTILEPLAVSLTAEPLWLNAYPNPTTGDLSVEWSAESGQPARLQITALNGLSVFDRLLRGTGQRQTERIRLTNLPGGIYLLQLSTETSTATKRIVKQ